MPPGCLSLSLFLVALALLPFFMANAVLAALGELGLGPASAAVAAAAIFLGGAVNVPVRRIPREEIVEVPRSGLFGLGRMAPRLVRRRTWAVLAVNVGGCVVPAGLAVWQVVRLAGHGPGSLAAAVAAVAVNVALCWKLARPVEGVGIVLPALAPGLAAAACALLLAPDRAPSVAFVAGVAGPLVGADLLHLEEMEGMTGMASIGGAGTFDGIVLSGIVATLLA